jgi:methionyl-tRNA formyltransferase
MRSLNCDLIFNQSQHIVRTPILEIPKIGVLNRHGAYLPKYRGRLAPFWQIYHREAFGGLTYHLLNENIDDGPIVYQEKLPISRHEDINSLIEKMFAVAVDKFGTVLQLLERPDASEYLIDNPSELATYYSSPRLVHAIRYRLQRLGVGRGAKA